MKFSYRDKHCKPTCPQMIYWNNVILSHLDEQAKQDFKDEYDEFWDRGVNGKITVWNKETMASREKYNLLDKLANANFFEHPCCLS